jgi:hypothetical protein
MTVAATSIETYHAIKEDGTLGKRQAEVLGNTFGSIVDSRGVRRGARFRDLAGQRFGRLVALEVVGRNTSRGMVWRCQCDCGCVSQHSSTGLVEGTTQSCGCYQQERRVECNTEHGMADTLIHGLWMSMMARCYTTTNEAYDRYGGRGIVVDERWHDFANFFADMGHRPEGKSLDRRDNNGPYSASNCRWATPTEQGRNMRTNRMLEFRGETRCMSEWCEILSLKTSTVCRRLNHFGWSVDRALATPVLPMKGVRSLAMSDVRYGRTPRTTPSAEQSEGALSS